MVDEIVSRFPGASVMRCSVTGKPYKVWFHRGQMGDLRLALKAAGIRISAMVLNFDGDKDVYSEETYDDGAFLVSE